MRETLAKSAPADDRRNIRDLIENWAIWRDAGMWDRFRTVWHSDGRMVATWFEGTAEEFIIQSQLSYARGVRILHFLGGSSIDIKGRRAVAQTKMTISQRGVVEEISCDAVCTGRFFDFLEKRRGKWGIVLRQPIYEKDRLDPVDPSQVPKLNRALLRGFPEGYRHLAYLQVKAGYNVKRNMPGLDGPQVDALYASGADWLRGGRLTWNRSSQTKPI